MNQQIRKLIFFVIIQVLFYNLLYILFIPEIYEKALYLIALIIYYIITFLDTLIRPLQDEERDPASDKYTIILLMIFFLNPVFLIASVIEGTVLIDQFLAIWIQEMISIIGILLFSIFGIMTLTGRIQLGKFATGKLSIQSEHELIEKGFYKYIRHPIYTSGILGGFAYLMIFNALIVPIVYTLLIFIVFNQRANYEESILLKQFGSKYAIYKQHTKKFIPFVY